ncbi:MAG: chromosome segregation protein SMC [Fusobacterium perfoetens]|uniref:chromosome segregation protein SMC n=1 Tax=Fusobacterium perfoetens TaxID=852 RepID=UPI0023F3470E|nr:chromosome segregation protein SMC [Fusobacterium perfoetens]MCI6151850.1 chromosome segregation protein SMC [Fusobacterium perfoetens]MDY3236789.1 chromosome segregation protein SMC [Fusobacterium perfoetens]
MHLKGIEIYGFKSFGERIKIDFNKGITSIVGPNGSGKSNILDSILWVLGEQSYKNIRAKESKDIIFSGGESKKSANNAEVSLFIDNKDGYFSTDEETLKITRKLYSSGENEYLINDKKARLKDISDMFLDTGIGKSAYSVIGQGKVERIISSSKKEVKEIIEEAAGVKKYQIRKLEAEKKLENVVNEVEKIELILTETGEQRTKIKKQAEKALEFLQIKEERDSLNKGINIFELLKNRENLEKTQEKNQELLESLNKIKNEKDEKEKEIKEVTENIQKIKNEIQLLMDKNENLKKIINDFEKEKAKLLEREEGFKREEKDRRDRIESFKEKLNKNQENHKILLEEKENLKVILEDGEDKVSSLEVQIKELESKKTTLEREVDLKKRQLMDLEVEKLHYENALENSEKRIKGSTVKINNLIKEIEEIDKKILDSNQLFEECKSKKENLEKQIAENDENQLQCEKNISDYSVKINRINDEIRKAEFDFSKNKERYDSIHRFEENNEGFYKGVKEILNLNIKGVEGALISIINIPEKFEKAIEASISGNLQDIVVENSGIAKKCIEILKEKKVGKASFLAMDTIKTFPKKDIPKLDGVIGRGSELISFEAKYQKIIDMVLGNLLIVEDVDTAINISKKNIFSGNIVSLSGEFISGTGRITGGENKVTAISQMFERRKEAKRLEELLKNLSNSIKKNKELYEKLNETLVELENKTQTLDTQNLSLRKEIKNLSEEFENLKSKNERFIKEKRVAISEKEEEEKYLLEYNKRIKESLDTKETIEKNTKETKMYIEIKSKEFELLSENIKKLNDEFSDIKIKFLNTKDRNIQIENDIEKNNNEKKELIEEEKIAKEKLEALIKELENIKNTLEKIEKDKMEKDLQFEKESRELLVSNEKEQFFQLKEKELIGIIKDIESKQYKEEEKLKNELEKIEEYQRKISFLEENINSMKEIKEKLVEESIYKSSIDRVKYLSNKLKDFETVNLLAVEEFKELDQKYNFIKTQKDDLETSRSSLLEIIEEISQAIRERFFDAYNNININFNQMCMETIDNSEGSLTLSNEEDFENCGVEIFVKFKNKKRQSLTLLSGGEKSMVAIAFIMAIFMYKPSPFTFLDEIEAALDEKNTKKLINKLKEFTDKSQFILITHNKETMRSSDSIFGVTMNKKIGISKIVPVNL